MKEGSEILSGKKICAVVVAYFPDTSALHNLLSVVSPQVSRVLVVNNTPPGNDGRTLCLSACCSIANVEIHDCGDNLGVAAGFNYGINYSNQHGFDYVVLLDQDSIPDSEMVSMLVMADKELTAKGIRVAAVGPCFTDSRTGKLSPIAVLGRWKYQYLCPNIDVAFIRAMAIVSSGKLICLKRIKVIGLMREDFFMDMVDIEWCM